MKLSFLRRSAKPAEPPGSEPVTDESIRLAYRLILKREVDDSGLASYRQRADAGLTLPELIASLLASDEYRARTADPLPESPNDTGALVGAPDEHRARQPRRIASESAEPTEPDPDGAQLIDPRDVIGRYSVEALAETADEYYRRVVDPTPLMIKPFSFLHETPDMLENMAALLSGLHLGKSMTVLDFGAGTCWLSRALAQLHCQVICCDVSEVALAIGRRLFAEVPVLGEGVPPVFLRFDGHRIDWPSASVDRIVCFDAFHHVPNQAEVLAEFARVLKPGGITGFSEPGPSHSRSPQSQYEMRNHRVLENDIRLREILRVARDVGFTDMLVRVVAGATVPLDDYEAMQDDARAPVAGVFLEEVRNSALTKSVFFLHKGPILPDSRSHIGLAHTLTVDQAECVVPDGAPLPLTFSLVNTGTARWLDSSHGALGTVRLGAHLYAAEGGLLEIDYFRYDLPASLGPGEKLTVTVDVPSPPLDAWRLTFDLVAEGVSWFENLGSKAVDVTVRRS